MSEDYKKIALEDVKKGQRVRVVERYPSHIATYEGVVVGTDLEVNEIGLGEGRHETTVYDVRSADTDILLLLEDAPTDTVVFGNDGVAKLSLTMTVLASGSVRVESDRGESFTFLTDMTHGGLTYFEDTGILRFASVEHWERHEPRLRDKMLKDSTGDVWAYIDGQWKYMEVDGQWKYLVEVDGWYDDVPIEDYIVKGCTIVDSLD